MESRAWALVVPGLPLIFRAISVQLAHRDQCARLAVVIVAAMLGLDVPVDRARDCLVRFARLMLWRIIAARSLSWPIRSGPPMAPGKTSPPAQA
jgi:hypothetical protein